MTSTDVSTGHDHAGTDDAGDHFTAPVHSPWAGDLTSVRSAGGGQDTGSHPRHGHVPLRRIGLLKDLAAVADDTPLILLVAAAGYGKTTVLRQWANEDGRAFGWIQLRESDNDPALLQRHIAGVLGRIRASGTSNPPETAKREAWVLVLDDAHMLHHGLCLEAVTALVEDLPEGCKVVLAGRARLDLDLNRRTGGLRYTEFRQNDLSLTSDEVEVLMADVGLTVSPDAAAVLRARTEGWPAVTYLAALSIRGATDVDAAAAAIGGDDAFIADYLRDEVLGSMPAEVAGFLMRTAPLQRMTAPLCDFVLGRSGSAVWLAEVDRHNLFAADEGEDRGWYRYHRLLSEMLRTELRRRQPCEEERVHRRAAAWYDAQDRPERAVHHALAGGDTASAAQMVSRYMDALIDEGKTRVLQRWLTQLDAGALEEHPLLAIQAGWIWAVGGEPAPALRCLLAAEAGARAAGEPASGTRLMAGAASLRAALAPDGVQGMVDEARRAVALQPEAEQDQARTAGQLGVAYALNGSPDAGATELARAAELGRRGARREGCFALAQLSLLAAEAGDWAAAAEYARESSTLTPRAGQAEYATGVPAHLAEATVALHRGDPRAARASLNRAQRLYAGPALAAFPWLGAQLAIGLGRILLELGDRAGAEVKAVDARRFLARLTTDGVLGDRYRDFATALHDHGERETTLLSTAEMRILDLLPTHLTLAEIADRLYLSRNTVKSQVAAVYRKLNASNRTEAVHAGRTYGLLTA
jgi:LuxR family maltose regulon positive regulatory protein